MRPSTETLLVLLIVALFLQDSLLLLRPDEALLVRGLRGRWRAGFGTRAWRLAGKEPYVSNPFLPHEPVFRLPWQLALAADGAGRDAAVASGLGVERAPRELMRLGGFVWLTWLALFVAVPAALTGRVPGLTLLVAAGLLYLSILASLCAAWLWRRPLGLPRKAFGPLAFECIVCAPYAANLVRRIAAARPVQGDFVQLAEQLLSPARLAIARRECAARVDERIEIEFGDEPATPLVPAPVPARLVALRASRARFGSEGIDERR